MRREGSRDFAEEDVDSLEMKDDPEPDHHVETCVCEWERERVGLGKSWGLLVSGMAASLHKHRE